MLRNILPCCFIILFFFAACNNKNSNVPAIPAPEFKAVINGNEWVADSVDVIHIADYGPLPNRFKINAYKNDGSKVFLFTNSDTNSVTIFSAILSSFTSSIDHPSSNAINLNWITTKEENLKDFVLEKSIDGNNFHDVATIPAKNYENGSSYFYNDKPVLNEILLANNSIFYRLKIVNTDDSFVYSSIISENPSTPALYVFPSQDYSWGFDGNTAITAVDEKLKLVSGSFNFKCVNDTTGKQFNITTGSFKNLHYTE
jgi:hypothetical protein